MTRSVLFDTETTGLDPLHGDRIIEIAAIELRNDLPTDRVFHTLIDPERDIPSDATRIHGITNADITGKPNFAAIADPLLDFFGDSPLVAHNAGFDFGFLDAELGRINRPSLDRARMIDTLALAKTRFPGLPNSLDALCRRFNIDLSLRTTHNALLDCKLLAAVYIELTGGRQRGLDLDTTDLHATSVHYAAIGNRTQRMVRVSVAEAKAHTDFIAKLKDPVWLNPAFTPLELE